MSADQGRRERRAARLEDDELDDEAAPQGYGRADVARALVGPVETTEVALAL